MNMENKQFELLMTEIKGINSRMNNLEAGLKQEINNVKTELREEINNVKTELREEIAMEINSLRIELKNNINSVKQELMAEDKSIRQTLQDSTFMLYSEIRAVKQELKDYKEINERQHSEIIQLLEKRFQECKRDREDLHEGLNTLHELYKYNEIKHKEYEKILTSIKS